jgi:thioredoxin reductase
MKDYDVVVVGGGAAGLSAALVLARARRTVAVVDAGRPRNAPAAHMHGFLSQDGMAPRDLLAAGRSEVASYGGHLIDDTVVGVEPGFHVRLCRRWSTGRCSGPGCGVSPVSPTWPSGVPSCAGAAGR